MNCVLITFKKLHLLGAFLESWNCQRTNITDYGILIYYIPVVGRTSSYFHENVRLKE